MCAHRGGRLEGGGEVRARKARYVRQLFEGQALIEPRFCMPARGNEKPDAEGTVKAVQKRFATPVPRVADLDELNRLFRKRCEAEREHVVQSLFGPFTIKDRLAAFEGIKQAVDSAVKAMARVFGPGSVTSPGTVTNACAPSM